MTDADYANIVSGEEIDAAQRMSFKTGGIIDVLFLRMSDGPELWQLKALRDRIDKMIEDREAEDGQRKRRKA